MSKDENRRGLGECADELEALDKALAIFDDADGCQHCCPEIGGDLPELTYHVNDSATRPGGNHEAHREDCAWRSKDGSYTELGKFHSAKGAVRAAQKVYDDADGCAHRRTEKSEGPAASASVSGREKTRAKPAGGFALAKPEGFYI